MKTPQYDLMGLGSRFTYKLRKEDETTPGPGMYSGVNNNSIEATSKSMMNSKSKSKLGFGVSRGQQEKLMDHG